VLATDVAIDVASLAFRAGGGSALYDSSDLQRCLRDIHAAAQHFVVSDAAYEALGKMRMGSIDPL
jgi:alkylation response protein AidB-like acyl-CoA dehydrogenase